MSVLGQSLSVGKRRRLGPNLIMTMRLDARSTGLGDASDNKQHLVQREGHHQFGFGE